LGARKCNSDMKKITEKSITEREGAILFKALAYYCLNAPMKQTKSAMKLMKKLTKTN